jgi:DNA-3-methyladenine glycosylase I
MNKTRCGWCNEDPLYIAYHDTEWGVPVYDDRLLFEFLILEGMQAGLSWITVLKKREAFRTAFSNFDATKIIKYNEHKVELLLNNPGIIRNKLKINAALKNAESFLRTQKEFGSFSEYIWGFVKGKTIQNRWRSSKLVPATTDISDRMSKDLKKRGFNFVGSTICYAYMQAIGIVNDHSINCFRHDELK